VHAVELRVGIGLIDVLANNGRVAETLLNVVEEGLLEFGVVDFVFVLLEDVVHRVVLVVLDVVEVGVGRGQLHRYGTLAFAVLQLFILLVQLRI